MRQLMIGLLFPLMAVSLFGQESGYSSIEHIYLSGSYVLGFDFEDIALAAAYKYLPSNVNVNSDKLPKLDRAAHDFRYKSTHRAHLNVTMLSTDLDLLDNCSATFIRVEIGVPAEFIHLEFESTGTRYMPIFSKWVFVAENTKSEIADNVRNLIEEAFIELAAKIEAYP